MPPRSATERRGLDKLCVMSDAAACRVAYVDRAFYSRDQQQNSRFELATAYISDEPCFVDNIFSSCFLDKEYCENRLLHICLFAFVSRGRYSPPRSYRLFRSSCALPVLRTLNTRGICWIRDDSSLVVVETLVCFRRP